VKNKERLTEFNRGNILSAAKRLFSEKGIAQTTVDDIAKEAGYSKSTLYVYFSGKEEIVNAVILEHFILLKQAVAGALQENNGFPGGYYAICNALAAFRDAYPLYFDIILGELAIPKDEAETILVQIYNTGEEINTLIEGYIAAHIRQGNIRIGIPALQAVFILWAGIGGVITLAAKKEPYIQKAMGLTKEQFMQDGFDFLLKTITGRETL